MKKEMLVAICTGLAITVLGITLVSTETDAETYPKSSSHMVKSSSDTQASFATQTRENYSQKPGQ